MRRYVFNRLAMVIFVVAGVILLLFTMLYFIPGDPAEIILGAAATKEQVAALREQMGLNDGYFVRLFRYVNDLIHLDLGTSYSSHVPVFQELVYRFPISFKLACLSALVAIAIGLPAGILSAVRQYSWIDNMANFFGVIGVSMPNFWLGLELSLVFALNLHWLPASGIDTWQGWVLPAITIGFNSSAAIMRMTRSTVLEVIRMDYIRTARSKGQKEFIVIMRHALKNAMIPVVTILGMQFGAMLGGTMIVETIFSIPGVGTYLVNAINARDFPVIMGGVLVLSVAYCLVNLGVDLIYAFLDPRIKSQYRARAARRSKA